MLRRILSLGLAAALLLPLLAGSAAAGPVANIAVTADVPPLSVGTVKCDPQPFDPTLGPGALWFTLSRPASVLVVVTDVLGGTQRIFGVPDAQAGRNDVAWDGTSMMGTLVARSWYAVTVSAKQSGMSAQKSAVVAVSYGTPLLMTAAGVKPSTFAPPADATFSAALSRDAYVSVAVADARGKVVRTAPASLWFAGTSSWVWDGRDDKGAVVGNGTYRCTLTGADSGGNTRTVAQSVTVKRK